MTEQQKAVGQNLGAARLQSTVAVLWPSFLAAALLTTVVFAAADPLLVFSSTGRSAVYTLGFVCFWIICASACWATMYYLRPVPERVLSPDLPPDTDEDRDSGFIKNGHKNATPNDRAT